MNAEYFVAAQAVQRDGKRYALVEVIDESECRNRWRINPAGKARALDSLLKKPLLGPPDAGHEATEVVGHPVDFTSNYATRVLYEIPDAKAWAEIESGRWGPVSPKLSILSSHDENGTLVLDGWEWDHVAFVPVGAFPNAGVKSTCMNDPRLCGFPTAVAGAAARFDSMRPTVGDLVGYRFGEYPRPQPRLLSFSEAVTAALTPNSTRYFDPMRGTVGDLVGKDINDSRMQIDASLPSDLSRPLGVVQAMISSKPFDPMKPTIGDLVGSKAVEAATNSPPVPRRINGKLDLSQPTIGDLVKPVRGRTPMGTISIEADDFLVHPRRIRTCSR